MYEDWLAADEEVVRLPAVLTGVAEIVELAVYEKPLEAPPVMEAVDDADVVLAETGSAVEEVPFPVTGAECVWVAMTVLPLFVSVHSVV